MSFGAPTFAPKHFLWKFENGVATITLNRPERKNALTFQSYAELRDIFRALNDARDVKVVVIRGAGGNFCSGGDVHEIIGPLTRMDRYGLLKFTRMTGDLVRAMRGCPQPIVAALEGVCAGAGAIMAMASDIRFGQPGCKTAFLFTRVGLSGADMGACARASSSSASSMVTFHSASSWRLVTACAIEGPLASVAASACASSCTSSARRL